MMWNGHDGSLGIPWGLSGLCQAITAVHRHGRSHRSHWSWCIWRAPWRISGKRMEKGGCGDASQAKNFVYLYVYLVFFYLFILFIYRYIMLYLFPDFCPKIKTKHPGFEPIRSGEPRNPKFCVIIFFPIHFFMGCPCCPCYIIFLIFPKKIPIMFGVAHVLEQAESKSHRLRTLPMPALGTATVRTVPGWTPS